MNYFPFNVGDYAAHTGHLEPMEDLAYRRLLDQYYLREGPLPADTEAVAKLVRMRSMKADVESVLNEFFTLTEDGWSHSRCDAEIEKMQDKQAKARASGLASANARSKAQQEAAERALMSAQTDVERSLGPEPTVVQLPTPTPTPTPIPKEEKDTRKRAPVSVSIKDMEADGVDPRHAAEWMAVRKAKRLPLTITGWDDTKAEATKAGLTAGEAVRLAVSNGWAGFKASWVSGLQTGRGGQPTASASDIFAGAM
jgi:uncharacterized protein YdaU (DUF1376 family)